jgi:hypothetical protein
VSDTPNEYSVKDCEVVAVRLTDDNFHDVIRWVEGYGNSVGAYVSWQGDDHRGRRAFEITNVVEHPIAAGASTYQAAVGDVVVLMQSGYVYATSEELFARHHDGVIVEGSRLTGMLPAAVEE